LYGQGRHSDAEAVPAEASNRRFVQVFARHCGTNPHLLRLLTVVSILLSILRERIEAHRSGGPIAFRDRRSIYLGEKTIARVVQAGRCPTRAEIWVQVPARAPICVPSNQTESHVALGSANSKGDQVARPASPAPRPGRRLRRSQCARQRAALTLRPSPPERQGMLFRDELADRARALDPPHRGDF
jgi:hypothetical protein